MRTLAADVEPRPLELDGLHEVACCLCGSTDITQRFREGPFEVVDCMACGLTYVTPQHGADLVERVYDGDYWRSEQPRQRGYANYLADAALHIKTFERRWRTLRPHLPQSGRALDVGCAAGFFLEVVRAHGWQVEGLEPSEGMARIAAERLGASSVQCAALENAQFADRKFDLITLWDVLEHVRDPVAALCKARELLTPGGLFVVETQDVRSAFARLMGRRWQHFKHREHLVHFQRETLERALAAAGLRLLEVRRKSAGKYVRGDFLVERSARIHSSLPRLLRPLLGGEWSVYVNLGDEMIALAEARA